jgi:hypothetical protein
MVARYEWTSQAPGPGADQSASAGDRPVRPVTDEIIGQIDEVRGRAGALDADLHRRGQSADHDTLSALERVLAAQARALEREIVTGRVAAPPRPDCPSPYQP